MLCRALEKLKVEVMKDVDGTDVRLPVACVMCGSTMTAHTAGVPDLWR